MTTDRQRGLPSEIGWEIRVPIFKNGLILRQLGFAIGIPFGVLMLFMLIEKAYYGLLIVGAALLLGVLLTLLIFRGTYDVQYFLDGKGIVCQNQVKQRERVKKLSAATFWLGLFSRNLTAAGAGMLSGTRAELKIPWNRVRKVKYKDGRMTVMIFAGFGENIALFCMTDNYFTVKQFVENKVK